MRLSRPLFLSKHMETSELCHYTRPKRNLKPVAETLGIRWGIYGEVPPKTMPPSGLLGPVRLLPLLRRTEKW